MNSKFIFSKLPLDIIKEILLFDFHFIQRNNKRIICIEKLSKKDPRFFLFDSIPKIIPQNENSWIVIFKKKNKKYILRHYLRPNNIWEFSFVVYALDSHSNMLDPTPDSILCIPLFGFL